MESITSSLNNIFYIILIIESNIILQVNHNIYITKKV